MRIWNLRRIRMFEQERPEKDQSFCRRSFWIPTLLFLIMVHLAVRSSRLHQRELIQALVMCPEQSAPEHVRSLEARLVSCRTTLFVRYRPSTARQYHAKLECKTAFEESWCFERSEKLLAAWPTSGSGLLLVRPTTWMKTTPAKTARCQVIITVY